ncbi:amidohydrolase family protein [Rudaea sp.]|uniref:amidohydrolase family protein n=1 Tax=Rudaea sp. TaxID=2136325 RepID=UPI002ED0F53B
MTGEYKKLKNTLALTLCLAVVAMDAVAGETVAIVHAQAWTMADATGGRIDDATIVIRDGRYESVAAKAPPPSGARVIDAAGRIVTLGLMSADTHLGLVEVSSLEETRDHGVESGPLGAAFDVQYGLNRNSLLLPVVLADGLTRAATSPTAASDAAFLGMGAVVRVQPGADVLDRAKAAMYASVGGFGAKQGGGSRSAQWQLLRNALDEAKTYAPPKSGAGAPRDQLQNVLNIAALHATIEQRMPLVVRVARESDIRQAVQLAEDYRLPLIVLGGTEAWRCADLLAARKVAVVLDPEADLPWTFDELGARADNAAMLARAGVTIAFSVSGNTIYLSHNAGVAVREGAGLAVANGLAYADAMKALTVNPARIFGIADHYGSMARGFDADLVIWNGDPFEPSSAPGAVFVRGAQASPITRQTLLRDRYAPKHATDPLPPAYRP